VPRGAPGVRGPQFGKHWLDGCINNMHSAAEASIRFENGRGVVDLGLKTRGVVGSKTSTDGGKSVIISYSCTL